MQKQAKKLLLSAGVVLTFIAYSFQQRHDGSGLILKPVSKPTDQSQSANSDNSNTNSANSTPTDQTSPATSTPSANGTTSSYKDGQYTGDAADAYYGYIQVKVTISSGKITDVVFLQYPNDRQNSIYINSQAMPILKQEAIQAQSAKVDIVSGATDTSSAFIQSLTSALNQAV